MGNNDYSDLRLLGVKTTLPKSPKEAILEKVDEAQVPVLDEIIIDTLVDLDDKAGFYREKIDGIGPGLTHLLFHPAINGEELQAIADTHLSRHADYLAWSKPETRQYIADAGIKQIGYRELRNHLAT